MILYVARHGETDDNKNKIMVGQTINSTLNHVGKKQAQVLAEQLKDIQFDIIYTSPLARAYDTTKYINQYHNKELISKNILMEVDVGEAVNHSYDCIAREEFNKSVFYRFQNGESHADLIARVYPFLRKLLTEYNNNLTILIVTHGEICKTIHSFFNTESNYEFAKDEWENCECRKYQISKQKT